MNFQTLDIVKLIEKSSLTRLSQTYQSKLLTKIKTLFTDAQQQLFVSSFYCYLNCNKTDFIIDLDNIWKWIGFERKEFAKKSLKKNFIVDIDYKIEKAATPVGVAASSTTNLGGAGLNKEQILMTVNTFKKFCLKAGTKKADEIHDYYIKLEELLQETMNEESEELRLQLEHKEIQVVNLTKEKILEKQNILLREFGTIGNLVYIIRVKTFKNGNYIIKIGESRRGMAGRFSEHLQKYTDECILLDCFMVNRSKDFENFLHNQLKNYRVKDFCGHETETELFLIGENTSYNTVLNIINNNIKYYNDNDNQIELQKAELNLEKAELELEQIKEFNKIITNKASKEFIQQIMTNKNILEKLDNLEKSNKELINIVNSLKTKTTNNFNQELKTIGPRLQQINPETFQLIKLYETVSELLAQNSIVKRPSISKAVINSTVYNGFRWAFVNRECDSSIVNISPTKVTKIQNIGYIAKLNYNKTEILNVYLDRKTASRLNNCKNIDNVVKNFSCSNGNYYQLYHLCNQDLQTKFENIHGRIILYTNGVGKYNINGELLKEFVCKNECSIQLNITNKTLTKALEYNTSYKDYIYKYLDPKISIKN